MSALTYVELVLMSSVPRQLVACALASATEHCGVSERKENILKRIEDWLRRTRKLGSSSACRLRLSFSDGALRGASIIYSNTLSIRFLPKNESNIQNPIISPMIVMTIISLSSNCSNDKPGFWKILYFA